jgi:hypothetical protein
LEPGESVLALVSGSRELDSDAFNLATLWDATQAWTVVVTQRHTYVFRSARLRWGRIAGVAAKHPIGAVAVRVTALPAWEPLLWVGDFRLQLDGATLRQAEEVAALAAAD